MAAPAASVAVGRIRRAATSTSSAAIASGSSAQILIATAKPTGARRRADGSGPTSGARAARRGKPRSGARQPIAVEDRDGAGQAEQVQPGLEQEGVGGDDRIRVDGVQAAGDARRDRASVPHQQAEQDDVGGVGADGQRPRGRQAPGGPGDLGQQRGRRHQEHGARRLHHGEIAVRDYPGDEAQRVAEQHPVVVLGHAEEVARPRQLVGAQEKGERRAGRDDRPERRLAFGQPAQARGGPNGRRAVTRMGVCCVLSRDDLPAPSSYPQSPTEIRR